MKLHKIIPIVFSLLFFGNLTAQFVKSPYSRNGVGDLLYQGLPNNFAMGEVGIGSPSQWHINNQNPSHLIYNKFSSFQVGISGDFRTFDSSNGTGSGSAASLRFLALSFPVVANRWTTSFSMLPLTTVNYNSFSIEEIDAGVTSATQFQGEGGITQLVWSNGLRLYKTLALGIKTSYLFGQTKKEATIIILEDSVSSTGLAYSEDTNYSDVNFAFGASYKWILSENKGWNFGLTYEVANTLSGSRSTYYLRPGVNTADLGVQNITEGETTSFTLPQSLGIGVSYEVANKWLLGGDLKTQSWRSAADATQKNTLRNTTTVSIGGAVTPDIRSVSSYLKRATYRFGANLRQVPYLIGGTEINDFGINFGMSLPVNIYSSMDLGFKFGQRGTTNNNLIQERYFKVVIGATINDRWFIKRRYD